MDQPIEAQVKVNFSGFAAENSSAVLHHHDYEPSRLEESDVEISITHCGICHSDLHLIDNDWKNSIYPFIPGHEIIGTVVAKGKDVKHLEIGNRVGVGWQCGSCLTCEQCIQGDENLCELSQPTCVGRNGGFANAIRVDGRFAFLIPADLSSENAAPLLCGGVTVYSPMRIYGVKPKDKVAVVGVGGLGHLALQFANAMGCEVTAISHSGDKESEALTLGAHHFINSSDQAQMKSLSSHFDFILTTVFADLDWSLYAGLLRPNGTLCFVGASPGEINMAPFSLIMGQKRIVGSAIGSRHMIMEMLDFAARHQVQAVTEVFPLDDVNEALDRLRAGNIRYRAVLKM